MDDNPRITAIQLRPTMKEALEVVDQLRADIESGKIRAFVGAAINDLDEAFEYSAAAAPTTELRKAGAIWWLLHAVYGES